MLIFTENKRRSTGLAVTTNPRVTMSVIGTGEASQAEAIAGTVLGRFMSPLRTKQAIEGGSFDTFHLASSGVLSFGGSDVTITHSSNLLTMAGGAFKIGAITYSGGTGNHHIFAEDTSTPIVFGTESEPSGLANNPTVWIQQDPAGSEQGAALIVARFGGVQTGSSIRYVSGNGTVTTPTSLGTGDLMSELRFDAVATNTGVEGGAENGFITLALIESHVGTGVVPNAQAGGPGQIDARQAAGKEATVTLSSGTPGVVNWTAHALPASSTNPLPKVVFRTTGTLPAEITAGTNYFVKTVLDANSFTISATDGGTAINFTGTGSGTITGMAFQIATIRTWELQPPSINDTHYHSWTTAQSGGNLTLTVKTDSGSGNVGLKTLLAGTDAAAQWANSATPTKPVFSIQSAASIENYVEVAGGITGNAATIRGAGESTVALQIQAKGNQSVYIGSTNGSIAAQFGNGAALENYLTFTPSSTNPIINTSSGDIAFSKNAVPTSSDGAALGTSSLMWSDLFLASGGVINWNNGEATISNDAANVISFGGNSNFRLLRPQNATTVFTINNSDTGSSARANFQLVSDAGVFAFSLASVAGGSGVTMTMPSASNGILSLTGPNASTGGSFTIRQTSANTVRLRVTQDTGEIALPSNITSTSTTTGTLIVTGGAGFSENVNVGGYVKSIHATAGIGYAIGAGGAVTQGTSRTTTVELNKVCGQITLFSAAGSATPASFTVTNSAVATTDTVILSQDSGTDKYILLVTAVGAGSFEITFYTTGGTTTEQPVINFSVIKAVAA